MDKDENLLKDFEEKYLKTKKTNRYLLCMVIFLTLVVVGIVIIVIINKKEGKGKEQEQGEEQGEGQGQGKENTTFDKCPEIKEVFGGPIGNGYIYSIWDCCKPSCSKTSNVGEGNEARTCDANMTIIPNNVTSICNGGSATTCLSQIPFTIEGCNNMGFAFAKVPGYKEICGRCFLLEFTGKGKDANRKYYELLKSKKLIVMATNFDYYDINAKTNQVFSILIPGGATGENNGCSSILGDNLGNKWGGLSGECVEEIGYIDDENLLYTKRKECIINKCNKVFANITQAREGCLFLPNFLEVVGDALFNFKEIECPQELKDKY